jgi:inner membrane protein
MDSLTQITLGAAMGELVLGRRIGNRAMLWGAVGGTIPDLDVLSQFWLPEIESLAFHRGVTHSLLFAVLTPFLFGWLTQRYYDSGLYRRAMLRQAYGLIWMLFGGALLIALAWAGRNLSFGPILLLLLALGASGWWWMRRGLDLYRRIPGVVKADYRGWVLLFFWSLFTHPLLDAFTPYGTQLFYPFSDYRVAFNVIAVVDPIYTFPFLGALLLAARLQREDVKRRRLAWFGVIWSSAYLGLCTVNKVQVDRVFQRSLSERGIEARRMTTAPTPFNNILWQGVVDADSVFYLGTYSLLDPESRVTDFRAVPKAIALPVEMQEEGYIRILQWFSNGYFTIREESPGRYHFSDLRYGGMYGDQGTVREERFIFRFELKSGDAGLEVRQLRPDRLEAGKLLGSLWTRLRGIPSSEG